MGYLKKLINQIKNYFQKKKRDREIEKRMKELRKRDPFTYNH